MSKKNELESAMSEEELIKSLNKKDGDQLFSVDEDFKALMGDEEDSMTLVFQHVSPDDDGVLTCVARTTRGLLSFGAVVQGELDEPHLESHEHLMDKKLIVGTHKKAAFKHWKPSVTVENKEVVVTEGDQAMLQVQIKGHPKPDIRCTWEGVHILPSKKYKIFHEDDEGILLLVIKNTNFEDSGIYTIMAENEIGFDSVDINLKVIRYKYPEIKTKSQDISIPIDQTLTIPAEVDGIPKPVVQFLRDGRPIIVNDRFKITEHSPNKYTLVISGTTIADSGVYSVVATNVLTQACQFWSLYVYSKPRFLQKLWSSKYLLSQGDTVILKTKIESQPKADIKWFKNEAQLKQVSKRIIIDDEDGYFILKIKDVIIQDAAVYTFSASNMYGSCCDSLTLNVKKAPTIIESFEDAEVLEQDVYHYIHIVTFGVKLEVFPQPKVKWYLDGAEIEESRSEFTRVETLEEIKLIINEVTTDLSGKYLCKIYNDCGTAEAYARLTVNCSPRILTQLNDITSVERTPLQMEVLVRGYPSPRFRWFRDGQEIEVDERTTIGLEAYGKHRYKISLVINCISYEERGEYELEVVNSFGASRSRCCVTVHTFPVILESSMKHAQLEEGSDITYVVKGFSDPPPRATWSWEGTSIDCDAHSKIISSHNDDQEFRLGLRKVKAIDTGVYQCVLSNYLGATRHRAVLEVVRKKRKEDE